VIEKESLLLRSVQINRTLADASRFPLNVPAIRSLEKLEFHAPVTFFVGENGSGKSTLLEAIAAAAGSITVGSEHAHTDRSLSGLKPLVDALKLVWSKRTRRGFFMRSEDFFGYARKMTALRAELERDLEEVDREYRDRSITARQYARSSYAGQLGALKGSYGEGLDARSHGESYLALFQARFVPEGLYLLDEPEAPLSPVRQLSFLALLNQMVAQKAQFLIATHSPLIMAFPGADILSFDGGALMPVAYEELEHVQVTRAFLENPNLYLRHLFQSPAESED
jgi:predicted ATPase